MRRYIDDDVVGIAEMIISGYTLLEIESESGISHSTAHDLIMRRLKMISPVLYNECLSTFHVNKRRAVNIINERNKNDRTTTSTKSD